MGGQRLPQTHWSAVIHQPESDFLEDHLGATKFSTMGPMMRWVSSQNNPGTTSENPVLESLFIVLELMWHDTRKSVCSWFHFSLDMTPFLVRNAHSQRNKNYKVCMQCACRGFNFLVLVIGLLIHYSVEWSLLWGWICSKIITFTVSEGKFTANHNKQFSISQDIWL